MTFVKILVPIVLAALVCVNAHHENEAGEKGCHDVVTQEGKEDMYHGQFACQLYTNGRKFLRCAHGQVHKFNCPGGLFWNMKKSECDWEPYTDCINPIPEDCPFADTSAGPKYLKHGQWACSDALGKAFRRCWGGVMYDWVCPVGTGMNTALGKCQWPGNIDCTV